MTSIVSEHRTRALIRVLIVKTTCRVINLSYLRLRIENEIEMDRILKIFFKLSMWNLDKWLFICDAMIK